MTPKAIFRGKLFIKSGPSRSVQFGLSRFDKIILIETMDELHLFDDNDKQICTIKIVLTKKVNDLKVKLEDLTNVVDKKKASWIEGVADYQVAEYFKKGYQAVLHKARINMPKMVTA